MNTTSAKPKRLTVPIGAAAARIEWGPLTPGVASVWINQTGNRVSVHATPRPTPRAGRVVRPRRRRDRSRDEGGGVMPGFFNCQWCSGKGCIACDAERKKYEKAETERVERERKMSPKAKLKELKNPLARVLAVAEGPGAEKRLAAEIAAVEAAVKAGHATMQDALDAEYARQFPDGPTPIFTARRDNPKDMDLLREVAGADAIEAAFSDRGGGIGQVLAAAEAARSQQDPPIDYRPIGRKAPD